MELESKSFVLMNKRHVSGLRKKMIAASQRWCCATCGQILDAMFEVDHKEPLCDGGSNDEQNLQALCKDCHARKTFLEQMLRVEAAPQRTHVSKETQVKTIECLWCRQIIQDPADPHQRYHETVITPFTKSCRHLQKLASHHKWKANLKLQSQVGAFIW
jgi:hypothetical protein